MFRWLRPRDPAARLQLRYERLLRDARDVLRSGDVVGNAELMEQAERIRAEIDALEASRRETRR